MVKDTLHQIIGTANDDAEKVAEFVFAYSDEMSKRAEGEMPAGIDPAALAGEEEAAAGIPPEMAGGEAEMADAMAGGDPGAAGGGEDIEQLVAVLEQLGITPEELEAAMAAGAGGEPGGELGGGELGGGLPAEAADPGLPPEAIAEEPAADEAAGMEVEASAKQAAAKKGSASKSTRDYIQEVLERSRR